MAQDKKMAMKPYMEAIEALCSGASPADLKAMIIGLAKEVSVKERRPFLDKLRLFSAGGGGIPAEDVADEKTELLKDIEILKEELTERNRQIEDGEYWELDDYDDYYHDEPESASEEQVEDLNDLFDRAGDLFLDADPTSAREIYRRLFDLIDSFDSLEYMIGDSREALKEAKARYCRCVYETAAPKDRVSEMIGAMEADASMNPYILNLEYEAFPMLKDVMEAKPGEMAGWKDFLGQWTEALERLGSDRSALLQLEASALLHGPAGPAKLAREWGKKQPWGYLYWVRDLAEREDWKVAAQAAIEAMEALNKGHFREEIAAHLVQAGQHLEDPELLLKGRREHFLSAPKERYLTAFVQEAERQNIRDAELGSLLKLYKKPGKKSEEGAIHAKLLLMAGKVDTAFDDARTEKSVGWSRGRAGLVFGSILYVVSGKPDTATTIHDLLRKYAEQESLDSWDMEDDNESLSLYHEIMKGLNRYEADAAEAKKYLNWAQKIGGGRIDQIVSNKYRRAYSSAASTLGALSECLILLDRKEDAQGLAREFYREKYSRFSAFRREVQAVFQGSKLLRVLKL